MLQCPQCPKISFLDTKHEHQLKDPLPKPTVRQLTKSTPGVAWTEALLGRGGGGGGLMWNVKQPCYK